MTLDFALVESASSPIIYRAYEYTSGRHLRSAERQGYQSGHYQRSLHTRAGDVKLKVPKLGKITSESAIMEQYKRREISVPDGESALMLVAAKLRLIAGSTWSELKYLNMNLLMDYSEGG